MPSELPVDVFIWKTLEMFEECPSDCKHTGLLFYHSVVQGIIWV